MNNSIILTNIGRFIFYFLLQVLICKRIDLTIGSFNYIHLLIYPIAVFMLPMKTPKALALIIAFLYGLAIDTFYDSPGVHAAAMVLSAYVKELIFRFLEPFEGYNINDVPTIKKMGLSWYVSFISVILFLHCFVYFSVEAFTFVYLIDILMNTIFSFIASFIMIMLFQLIFRPNM